MGKGGHVANLADILRSALILDVRDRAILAERLLAIAKGGETDLVIPGWYHEAVNHLRFDNRSLTVAAQ
jgi:hypothetical protein